MLLRGIGLDNAVTRRGEPMFIGIGVLERRGMLLDVRVGKGRNGEKR